MARKHIFHITAENGGIIRGTRQPDFLDGTRGDDIILGMERGDLISSSSGRDYIDGGSGFDIVSYARLSSPIRVVLDNAGSGLVYMEDPTKTAAFYADPNTRGKEEEAVSRLLHNGDVKFSTHPPKFIPGYAIKDVLWKVEGAIGGDGNDLFVCDSQKNFFAGGPGKDILIGGGGADNFAYWVEDTYHHTLEIFDAILDFNPQEGDVIDLSGLSAYLGTPLTFAWITSSYVSSVPYSVFYRKGVDPGDNPLRGDPRFKNAAEEPLYKEEEGLSLMMDLDGDAHADFMIAIWGTDKMRETDLIL